MVSNLELSDKFFLYLVFIDEQTCTQVAAAGCPFCKAALHRSDYPRKPRGGLWAAAEALFSKRISLCCARQGCRRRTTPASVRFLGRRVYLSIAVLLASMLLQTMTAKAVHLKTQVPLRTVRRWSEFWHSELPKTPWFQTQRASFMPPLCTATLPTSLIQRFVTPQRSDHEVLLLTLCFLSPTTTAATVDGARYLRFPIPPAEDGTPSGGS
jgi:hypothetical protein